MAVRRQPVVAFFVVDSMSKIGDWSQRAPYLAGVLEAERQADAIDFRNTYVFDDV
jgi:hypothetical protein